MSGRYFCIHGHFYQPPRENPWLGVVEARPSAKPFHDWNELVCRKCYAPNAMARIMGEDGLIAGFLNNYELMSFNFGPTLLGWMEKNHPRVYKRVLEADKMSCRRFSGRGGALAQVYNHIIMPLATRRDKLTQIRWGRADFLSRFKREPDGMWLAETAVDLETLTLLAREGIRFTILSPGQALAVRPLDKNGNRTDADWLDASESKIDHGKPYRVFVEGGRNKYIDVFFFDGRMSRAAAYDRLLVSGEWLLGRITAALGEDNGASRLVNLAIDCEPYIRNLNFGDMTLAWVLNQTEHNQDIQPINYAAFLEDHPPDHEARIIENSSWGCIHGVERWRADCGCTTGGNPGWNQGWRAPLREGLDWLAGEMSSIFTRRGDELLRDPWAARDDYIMILLQPDDEVRESFLALHKTKDLNPEERVEVFSLLESQVMSLFMFTSCAWFYDDIARPEPAQNLKYAIRGIELLKPYTDVDLEAGLLEYLARAKSNDSTYKNGVGVYRKMALPSRIDPSLIVAHYALMNFIPNEKHEDFITGKIRFRRERRLSGPGFNLILGEAWVRENMTGREDPRVFLAVHQGGPNMKCLVAHGRDLDFDSMNWQLNEAIEEASPEIAVKAFTEEFPEFREIKLEDLIPECQGRIVQSLSGHIFEDLRARAWESLRDYEDILKFLVQSGEHVPETLGLILGLELTDRLAWLFEVGAKNGFLDQEHVRALAEQAHAWDISLNEPHIAARARSYMEQQFAALGENPSEKAVRQLIRFFHLARDLELDLDLWTCQNRYYDLYRDNLFMERLAPAEADSFMELGQDLGFTAGSVDSGRCFY